MITEEIELHVARLEEMELPVSEQLILCVEELQSKLSILNQDEQLTSLTQDITVFLERARLNQDVSPVQLVADIQMYVTSTFCKLEREREDETLNKIWKEYFKEFINLRAIAESPVEESASEYIRVSKEYIQEISNVTELKSIIAIRCLEFVNYIGDRHLTPELRMHFKMLEGIVETLDGILPNSLTPILKHITKFLQARRLTMPANIRKAVEIFNDEFAQLSEKYTSLVEA